MVELFLFSFVLLPFCFSLAGDEFTCLMPSLPSYFERNVSLRYLRAYIFFVSSRLPYDWTHNNAPRQLPCFQKVKWTTLHICTTVAPDTIIPHNVPKKAPAASCLPCSRGRWAYTPVLKERSSSVAVFPKGTVERERWRKIYRSVLKHSSISWYHNFSRCYSVVRKGWFENHFSNTL